jgi:hypothetical protein
LGATRAAQSLAPQGCRPFAAAQPKTLRPTGHTSPRGRLSGYLRRRSAVQSSAALETGAICALPCFWKQDRQSTGRPCVGLNGTVVSIPHSEQVVRVSGRTRKFPRARLALHCLQCLGSFLNCLSWKKTCSPAVKINSAPQSLHFRTRSVNSMARLPRTGRRTVIGHINGDVPVAVPCIRSCSQQGPGPREKACGNISLPLLRRTVKLQIAQRVLSDY